MRHNYSPFSPRVGVIMVMLAGATLSGCGAYSPNDSFAVQLNIPAMDHDLSFSPEVTLQRDPQRGTIRFLKGPNLSQELEKDPRFQALQVEGRFGDVALAFLHGHRSEVKLIQPLQELVIHSITSDDLGFTHVRLQQIFTGIPVWGAEILVQLNPGKHVNLVNGRYFPTPQNITKIPALTADAAEGIVAAHLNQPQSSCPACTSTLVIFITEAHEPRLAYRVLATVSLREGWATTVDAGTGAILQQEPTVYSQSTN